MTGRLSGMDVMLSRRDLMQTDVLFEISATESGAPVPTIAPPGHGALPWSAIPVDPEGMAGAAKDWVRADLSGLDIHVTEGEVLAIVLKLDTAGQVPQNPDRQFDILWSGKTDDLYPGGSIFTHPPIPGAAWIPLPLGNDAGFRTWVDAVQTVGIDVKPGGEATPINTGAAGVLPVAILGDDRFDASTVDPASVRVNAAPVLTRPGGHLAAAFEDVNADGRIDLLVHVSLPALQEMGEEPEIIVTGSTVDGVPFRGSERVVPVPGL
jgi:hypothetical protein